MPCWSSNSPADLEEEVLQLTEHCCCPVHVVMVLSPVWAQTECWSHIKHMAGRHDAGKAAAVAVAA